MRKRLSAIVTCFGILVSVDLHANSERLCPLRGEQRSAAIGQCNFNCLWVAMVDGENVDNATRQVERNRNAMEPFVTYPERLEYELLNKFRTLKANWSANRERCLRTILPSFSWGSANRYPGEVVNTVVSRIQNDDCAAYRRGWIDLTFGNMNFRFQIPSSVDGRDFDPVRDFGSNGVSEDRVKTKVNEFIGDMRRNFAVCEGAHSLALRRTGELRRQPTLILNQLRQNARYDASTIDALEAYRCSKREDDACPRPGMIRSIVESVVDLAVTQMYGPPPPRSISGYRPLPEGRQ